MNMLFIRKYENRLMSIGYESSETETSVHKPRGGIDNVQGTGGVSRMQQKFKTGEETSTGDRCD